MSPHAEDRIIAMLERIAVALERRQDAVDAVLARGLPRNAAVHYRELGEERPSEGTINRSLNRHYRSAGEEPE